MWQYRVHFWWRKYLHRTSKHRDGFVHRYSVQFRMVYTVHIQWKHDFKMSLSSYNIREWITVQRYVQCDQVRCSQLHQYTAEISTGFVPVQNTSGSHSEWTQLFNVKGSEYTSKFVRRHRRRRNVAPLMLHKKIPLAILALSVKRTVTRGYHWLREDVASTVPTPFT